LTRRAAFDDGRRRELRWNPTLDRLVIVATATCSSERESRNENDEYQSAEILPTLSVIPSLRQPASLCPSQERP
jgi:hypothetical protein